MIRALRAVAKSRLKPKSDLSSSSALVAVVRLSLIWTFPIGSLSNQNMMVITMTARMRTMRKPIAMFTSRPVIML